MGRGQLALLAVNVLLRLLIVVFTVDALVNAGDDRFAGKALGPRNVGIVLGLSMLFPLLQAVRGQWKRCPMWYDTVEWWGHVPDFHGPGALAAVFMGAFGLGAIAAAGLSTMLHVALETQEYYGDVLLHTHNVNGIQDSMNDILFGLAGVVVYTIVFANSHYLNRRRAPKKRSHSR